MNERVNILAIGAHPDDIEFGCGGIADQVHAARATALFLLVMTGGGLGAPAETRMAEQEAPGGSWGRRRSSGAATTTRTCAVDVELIKKIEGVIARGAARNSSSATFRTTPTRTTGTWRRPSCPPRATSATSFSTRARPPRTSTPRSTSTSPTRWRPKLDALRAHRSQVMKTNIEDLSIIEVARSCANFRGIQGRVKYAEAFHSLRLFINI
ncbi:MAG: hypothetical protein MZV70_06340 [Desulfobacterales bacterium]|nr:hypothetical protein [Desulfobacterales bacterium]